MRAANQLPKDSPDDRKGSGIVSPIPTNSTAEQLNHSRISIPALRISQRVFSDVLSITEAIALCVISFVLYQIIFQLGSWSTAGLGFAVIIACVSLAGSSLVNRKTITLPTLNIPPLLSAAAIGIVSAIYLLVAFQRRTVAIVEISTALTVCAYLGKQLKISLWNLGIRRGFLRRLIAVIEGKPTRRDQALALIVEQRDVQVVFFGGDDRLAVVERLARDGLLDEVYLVDKSTLELEQRLIGMDLCVLRADLPNDPFSLANPAKYRTYISTIHQPRCRDWQAVAKRFLDIAGSLALLVFLGPLMLGIAAIIKLDSRGPVFFLQERFGYRMRTFKIMKFRTMYAADSDSTGERLTTRNDPRVTKIGWFLRRSSIDELPQLFNVLMGDMSLVGPRPHPRGAKAGGHLYDDLIPNFYLRYTMPPGMTGLAQIHGFRGNTETEMDLRLRFDKDLEYARTWSLWLEIAIFFGTARHLIQGGNAY